MAHQTWRINRPLLDFVSIPVYNYNMLEYLGSKAFLGDLSLEDADVLAYWASKSQCILEFGSGGSTQIMSQCAVQHIDSVETSPEWAAITQSRLDLIPGHAPVVFHAYTTKFDHTYNMVFVDGVDHLRRDFAIAAWSNLHTNGVMIFHDTRRSRDFQHVAWIAQLHHNEISRIDVNVPASNGQSSNITVIHKKSQEPYVNWNQTEGKPAWAYGLPDEELHPLWSQYD